jgi:Domain of unknown function (DUF4367)
MNVRCVAYTISLIALLSLVASCGAASTATVSTALPLETVPNRQSQDAWILARARLPANIAMYQPTFVPERFGAPTLLEARTTSADGAVYTIVYSAPNENLAFILNMGKGAFGNVPPLERVESITVLGRQGELESSSEIHTVSAFWQSSGQHYQITAYSQQITTDEMKKIIDSLIQQ